MSKSFTERILDLVPGFIRQDFARKFISLAFAILLFVMVTERMGKEASIDDVKVNVTVPHNVVNLDATTPLVAVRVKASEKQLNRLTETDLKINVEFNAAVDGNRTYKCRISPTDVKHPMGVTIIDVTPKTIDLNLDNKQSKKVEIKPTFSHRPPADYTVGKVTITPDVVTLIGPSVSVKKLETVKTAPISLKGVHDGTFDYEAVQLVAPEGIKASPTRVHVQVEIVRAVETRSFRSVPIRILFPRGDLALRAELLDTPNVDVTITGLKQQVEILKKEAIKPYVDVSAFDKPGVYNVHVDCMVGGSDTRIESVYPQSVQVKLATITPATKEK